MNDILKNTLVLGLVALAGLFLLAGCSKSDNPVDSEEGITERNLFPFAPGRVFVFSAYTLDTLGRKIESSTHREAIYVHSAVTIGGKSAYRLIDSVYFTNGTLNFTDTTYFAEEQGNLLIYYGTPAAGSWVTLFKRSEGIDKEYDGGSFTEVIFGVPITVTVKCKIRPKETVIAPIGSMQAYKLEVKTSARFGGQTFEFLQYVWFADGFGPVKQQEPVQVDPTLGIRLQGYESLMVSKNF
jgi:hypothetical protein